jgi:RND family efflux transporter MFP subunit
MRPIYLIFIVFILFFQVGCSAPVDAERQVIYQTVTAVTVKEQTDFAIDRSFTGVIQPAQAAQLAFEFAGTVQTVLVDEGDRVEEGELLARLDTALLSIERRQLQAQLAEAEANLRLTEANLSRQTSLQSDGYASLQRRDELEAGRDAIRANISQLEAALDGNTVRQEKAHLYAPFAGVISERYLEQGSAASPGGPVFRVLEISRLEAHVGVPRSLANVVATGDVVELRVAGKSTHGEVLAIGAELKAGSHAVMMRMTLPEGVGLAGSVVELRLTDAVRGSGFVIPETALTASLRGLWRVYVLLPDADDLKKVEARDLQLRFVGEKRAFVEGGLRDGEIIVATGVHKIVPGQLVRIVDAS